MAPERPLQLERPSLNRSLGELISGAMLQAIVFVTLGVGLELRRSADSPEAFLVLAGGWALGYLLWVNGLLRPRAKEAHEVEPLWHVGGMLLAIVVGTPFLPSHHWLSAAILLGGWLVFALPPALWGVMRRRAVRLQAQGWSQDPPATWRELRPWLAAWGVAVAVFLGLLALSVRV